MEEDRIVSEDRQKFPDCFHSISSSQSCKTDEGGKFVCTALKQIYRNCPRNPKQSEMIYSSREQNDGGGMKPIDFGDLNDILAKEFGFLGSSFGNIQQNAPRRKVQVRKPVEEKSQQGSTIQFSFGSETLDNSFSPDTGTSDSTDGNTSSFWRSLGFTGSDSKTASKGQVGSVDIGPKSEEKGIKGKGTDKPRGRLAGDSEDI
jgi:hypothetical protein